MSERAALLLVVVTACFAGRGCGGDVVAPCNFDEDCRADAVCLEGVCALRAPSADVDELPATLPPPPPPCVDEGTHDGGDGACVALDACSEGFTLLFRDEDRDGFGADARLDCAALPPPLGLADVDGDCDDANAAAFVITSSLADVDNDGFTTTIEACGNGEPPLGAPAAPTLAPILAAYPSDPRLRFVDDDGPTLQTQRFFDNDRAIFAGLRCPLLPATPQGLAVHARMRLTSVCCGPTNVRLLVSARFNVDDVAEERVAVTGPIAVGDSFDVVIGGATETFGFDGDGDGDGDLASACGNGFTIEVLDLSAVDGPVGGIADSATVVVDSAWLEVFGAEDCDDDDPSRFAPGTLYDDSDGDGQGGGDGVPTCTSADLPALPDGHLAPLDCDDANPEVRLGQTLSFTAPNAAGSFDYDCNGIEQADGFTSAAQCVDDGEGNCSTVETAVSGPCGSLVDVQRCDASCALADAPVVQPCR